MPPILNPRDRRLAVTPVVVVSANDASGFAFAERTHAVNVSGTGICFQSVHELPIGSRVGLRVLIPRAWRAHFSGRPVYPVRGIVRRSERSPSDGRFQVAVRFTGDDASS